jgi:hypothetical protein
MLLDCPGAGPCRGVVGNCGDLPAVFADTPVPPYFEDGLKDYTCTTFPDDERPLDSFVVGLIALAIAMPVTHFLQVCFELANDSEAPEVRYRVRVCVCMIAHAHARVWARRAGCSTAAS